MQGSAHTGRWWLALGISHHSRQISLEICLKFNYLSPFSGYDRRIATTTKVLGRSLLCFALSNRLKEPCEWGRFPPWDGQGLQRDHTTEWYTHTPAAAAAVNKLYLRCLELPTEILIQCLQCTIGRGVC